MRLCSTVFVGHMPLLQHSLVGSALRDIIANLFLQIAVVRNTNNSDSLASLARNGALAAQ